MIHTIGPIEERLVDNGFRHVHEMFKREYPIYGWMLGGVAGEVRRDIQVYLAFAHQVLGLMTQPPAPLATSPAWDAARNQLRETLNSTTNDPLHAALVDVIRRRRIPKQLPFDLFDGVDTWIRFGRFDSYEAMAHFAAETGGSTMNALVAIVGFDRSGFEQAAAKAGQAVALSHLLRQSGLPTEHARSYLPVDFLRKYQLKADELDPHNHDPEFDQRFAMLIRALASRIELEFFEGASLFPYLNFDGQRILKSLFAVHWYLLNRIKEDPCHALNTPIGLSRRESIRLRIHHLLGTEGSGIPFVATMKSLISADHH